MIFSPPCSPRAPPSAPPIPTQLQPTPLTVSGHERVALDRRLKHRGQVVRVDRQHLARLVERLRHEREVLARHEGAEAVAQLHDVCDDLLQPLLRQLEAAAKAARVALAARGVLERRRAQQAHDVRLDEVRQDHAHEAVEKEAEMGGRREREEEPTQDRRAPRSAAASVTCAQHVPRPSLIPTNWLSSAPSPPAASPSKTVRPAMCPRLSSPTATPPTHPPTLSHSHRRLTRPAASATRGSSPRPSPR